MGFRTCRVVVDGGHDQLDAWKWMYPCMKECEIEKEAWEVGIV